MRHLEGRALRLALDSYVDRLAQRDFVEVGHRVRSPQSLMRWMAAYAAATSSTASYERIRDAATSGEGDKPARTTTQPYREALERLYVVDPLPAWLPSRNRLSRLVASPKHHMADPAIAARLLGVDAGALLSGATGVPPIPNGSTLMGALFESLVTLSVRVYARHAEARTGHLRPDRASTRSS